MINTQRLTHIYVTFLLPALIGFVAVHWALQSGYIELLSRQDRAMVAVPLFVLTAISALAAPILYRAFFAHWHRHRLTMPLETLVRFECNLIGITMVTPYLALVAYLLQVPRFHFSGILLMAMYAVYYYFPSQRRISADRKIFRAAPAGVPGADHN